MGSSHARQPIVTHRKVGFLSTVQCRVSGVHSGRSVDTHGINLHTVLIGMIHDDLPVTVLSPCTAFPPEAMMRSTEPFTRLGLTL